MKKDYAHSIQDDTISRKAAIDAIVKRLGIKDESFLTEQEKTIVKVLRDMPSAQPDPAIPLLWIEEHIEWLKSLDNEFANLTAMQISTMVKKWRGEQDG